MSDHEHAYITVTEAVILELFRRQLVDARVAGIPDSMTLTWFEEMFELHKIVATTRIRLLALLEELINEPK